MYIAMITMVKRFLWGFFFLVGVFLEHILAVGLVHRVSDEWWI